MVRKLAIRLFLGFMALMLIAVLSVCIAAFLAFRQPSFYADLRAQQFSRDDQLAAQAFLQQMETDLRTWQRRSVALQHRQLTITPVTAVSDAGRNKYNPKQDTHRVTITQAQINALLTSDETTSRQWQEPRVQMEPDGIWFACEVVTSQAECVVSVQLQPTLTPERRLRVDLVSARIGQLPLPLKTVLGLLPREVHHLGHNMELDLTTATPHICLDISGDDPNTPSVKSIQCLEGAVTIEFLAPVLKPQQNERAATPHAASRQRPRFH